MFTKISSLNLTHRLPETTTNITLSKHRTIYKYVCTDTFITTISPLVPFFQSLYQYIFKIYELRVFELLQPQP